MTSPPDPTDLFTPLLAAHRRIEEQLVRLDEVSGTRGKPATASDGDAAQLVRVVLEFFAGPGARHQLEEERVLFPRMRPVPAFAVMLPAFQVQHQMIDVEYAALLAEVDGGARGGIAQLRKLTGRFAEMHRGHLIGEEKILFPLIAHELSAEAKIELSRELSEGSADPTT
jgi:iron-sulfur cluster repair protein YtfE (RIC family)